MSWHQKAKFLELWNEIIKGSKFESGGVHFGDLDLALESSPSRRPLQYVL